MRFENIRALDSLEEACRSGILRGWGDLTASDPCAGFNQSPEWCLAWYRAYRERFQPCVIAAVDGQELVGVATLAVDTAQHRLTFAGDNLNDYRDVIATPASRRAIVHEVVRFFRAGRFSAPLRIGPTEPGSESVDHVTAACADLGLLYPVVGAEVCFRRTFSGPEEIRDLLRGKPLRRFNKYAKEAQLSVDRLPLPDRWPSTRAVFFDNHCLRQLRAGRRRSFNDPRKIALYDSLVSAHPNRMHMSTLTAHGRTVAEHLGYISRGFLTVGMPAFDSLEEKHSPGLVLLAMLVQQASREGYSGVDFTPGAEDYKRRLSNRTLEARVVDVWPRGQYARRQLFAGVRGLARRLRVDKIRQVAAKRVERFQSWRSILNRDGGTLAVWELQHVARRGNGPAAAADPGLEVNSGELRDLLKLQYSDKALSIMLGDWVESLERGDALHTFVRNGVLLGWARSSLWDQKTAGAAGIPGGSVIYDIEVVPAHRTPTVVSAILNGLATLPEFEPTGSLYIVGDRTRLRWLTRLGDVPVRFVGTCRSPRPDKARDDASPVQPDE